MKETNTESFTRQISEDIINLYYKSMQDYLSQQDGKILEGDVVVMIMNICLGTAVNIYYSIRDIMPNTQIDFDFARASIINKMSKNFDDIKEYKKETPVQLTPSQLNDIQNNGKTLIEMPNGIKKEISKKDIIAKKTEVDKLKTEKNNKPRIILPN